MVSVLDIKELDICNLSAIEDFVTKIQPDVIINAAAYTAVDKAEEDIEKAYLLNRDAVANLAKVAQTKKIYLAHISTDYVFSGEDCHPYPTDAPANLGLAVSIHFRGM